MYQIVVLYSQSDTLLSINAMSLQISMVAWLFELLAGGVSMLPKTPSMFLGKSPSLKAIDIGGI